MFFHSTKGANWDLFHLLTNAQEVTSETEEFKATALNHFHVAVMRNSKTLFGSWLVASVPRLTHLSCGLSSLSHNHLSLPHTFEMQPTGPWNCNSPRSLPRGCPRLHPDFEVPLQEPHLAIKALPPRYSHCCHSGGTVSRFEGAEWSGEGKQAQLSVRMLHHDSEMWKEGISFFAETIWPSVNLFPS